MMRLYYVGALLLVPFCASAQGWIMEASADDTRLSEAHFEREFQPGYFLNPTEHHPQNSVPLIQNAGVGAFVSVGNDRVFNVASLNAQTDRIIAIDYDPIAVEFNRINTLLLRISRDQEDYRRLRWGELSWPLVEQRVRETPGINPLLLASFDSKKYHGFTEVTNRDGFDALNRRGPQKVEQGNYLFEKPQYERLKILADADLIESYLGDFSDEKFVRRLESSLENKKAKISVLDLSTAWKGSFLGNFGVDKIVGVLKKQSNAGVLLLVDMFVRPGSSAAASNSDSPRVVPSEFGYFSFSMNPHSDNPALNNFLRLRYPAYPRLIGKVDADIVSIMQDEQERLLSSDGDSVEGCATRLSK